MMQSIKIDIVYYDTPSDFEFEFNLGGCCRNARILNAKTSSPKEMICALAKAVGRSRIVMIAGPLSGDTGTMALVAKAISKKCVLVDRERFHIRSHDEVNAIDGSLPLVTADGTFGGCIIESGPQSIIVLGDNKSIRNDILEQLVFQYITSLARTPDAENDLIAPEGKVTDEQPKTAEESEFSEAQAVPEPVVPMTEAANIPIPVAIPVVTPTVDPPEFANEETPETENKSTLPLPEEEPEEFEEPLLILDEGESTAEDIFVPVPSEVDAPIYFANGDEEQHQEDDSLFFTSGEEEPDPLLEVVPAQTDESNTLYNIENTAEDHGISPMNYRMSGRNGGLKITIIILLAALLLTIGLLLYFAVFLPGKDGQSVAEYFDHLTTAFGSILW